MTKGIRAGSSRFTPGYQARQRWQRKVDRARQVPIEAVAHALGYGPFENAGRGEMRCRCPFHPDENPSFFMNMDKGLFICFGCQVGGDQVKLYQLGRSLDFRGAVLEMAKRF